MNVLRPEAYFYAGTRRWLDEDRIGAKELFRKCLETGVTNFQEYESAKAGLQALEKGK